MNDSYLKYLSVYQYNPAKKRRFGAQGDGSTKPELRYGDGGYVIGDIGPIYDCYISAGVNDEESFSRDFIRYYQFNETNAFAFDGTINQYPYQYTTDISFIRKNINSFCDSKNTDLKYYTQKYNNIFLKMDIEGGEFPWINSLSEDDLKKFAQIVIEFHDITNNRMGGPLEQKIPAYEKLAKTHYIIHVHQNSSGGHDNGMPNVMEFTLIRKDFFNAPPALNTTQFPIKGLDYPNCPLPYQNYNFPPFYHGYTNVIIPPNSP
jgi:hypothetical protein